MAKKSLKELSIERGFQQEPEQPEQEVLDATTAGPEDEFGQMALYDIPEPKPTPEEEEAAATIADIMKTILQQEEIRSSREYKASDLLAKIDEIKLLAEQGSRSGEIATACKSAEADAAALFEATGNEKFSRIADNLAAVREMLALQGKIEKQRPQTPTESTVFCPEQIDPQTGEKTPEQEFILPAQLEEYRKRNPLGAKLWEQQRAEKETHTIFINTKCDDPKLDPNSPEFDAEAWEQAVTAAFDALPAEKQRIIDALSTSLASQQDTIKAALNAIKDSMDILQREALQAVKESVAPPSNLARAEKSNALTICERLFVPSDKEFQDAFISSVSPNTNVGLFERVGAGKRQLALDFNVMILQALAMMLFNDASFYGNSSVLGTEVKFADVNFLDFAKALGFDINQRTVGAESANISRAEAREKFVNEVFNKMANIWGVVPNDTKEYPAIIFQYYNRETGVLSVGSPYLQRLLRAIVEKANEKIVSSKRPYLWHCDLLHAAAASERNRPAVEMATRILVGVQQRGMTPDAKLPQNKGRRIKDKAAVTWRISCQGLIEECPQIRERLKQQPDASAKTKVLKRTFTAMYRILREKTDLYNYYSDVTIKDVIPTSRSLDADITITHHGGNPKYKRPKLPLKDESPTATDANEL